MIARTHFERLDAGHESARVAAARPAVGMDTAARRPDEPIDELGRDEGGECPPDCPLRRPWCP
jgi:hypothetical protein